MKSKMRTALFNGAVLCLALLAASCSRSASLKKSAHSLSTEPSIERAADILSRTQEGKILLDYLAKNSVSAEYRALKGPWPKLMPGERKILIPKSVRKSDITAALLLARSADIYMTYTRTGVFDLLAEQEEIAALAQARLALELGFSDSDAKKSPAGAAVLEELCPYLFQGSRAAMDVARKNAREPCPEYGRPLETAESVRNWLEKTQTAIMEGSLAQVLYQRDLEKVKRKTLTMAEAAKNYADRRALPQYDIFRAQRNFYMDQMKTLSDMNKLLESAMETDAEWKETHVPEIEKGLREFSACAP